MSEMYNVGKIVNTHGLKGEVRVISITDFPDERYKRGSNLIIEDVITKKKIQVTVSSFRKHKQFYLLKFIDYDDISSVEQFKGSNLKVESQYLKQLPENEYYYYEIIGCTVYCQNKTTIGVVTSIYSTSANDVWSIKTSEEKEILIPYIEQVVEKVDVKKKQIVLREWEGFL